MTRFVATRWGLVAICLATFIAITILADQISEHVPHSEDEVAYVYQAKVFAQNRLAGPIPPLKDAFWTPFVVDYNGRRFGKYPPGWPLLLSLGVRLNAPWLINTSLATVTLALIAWLGNRYYRGARLGLWAAGLGLITPGFLLLSSSLLSHSASLFWTTVSLAALYCLVSRPGKNAAESAQPLPRLHPSAWQPMFALVIGLALGALFITRPLTALGIGLAVGIFVLTLLRQGELKWIELLWSLGGLVLVAAILPLYWWAITGDPTFNAYTLVWPYDRLGFGPDIGPKGYTLVDAFLVNTRIKLWTLAFGLFGWPGFSNLIFLLLPFLTRRANRWDWLMLGILIGVIFIYCFYWAFGGADGGFPRYYYETLPALLLLTVRGIQISVDWVARWQPRLSWLPVGLVMLFIAFNLAWNLPAHLAAQKGKYDITPAPLEIVERANLPEPALVLVKNVDLWSDFAAPFAANSPTLDGTVIYAIAWNPQASQRLQAQFNERTCWELVGQSLTRCPR